MAGEPSPKAHLRVAIDSELYLQLKIERVREGDFEGEIVEKALRAYFAKRAGR